MSTSSNGPNAPDSKPEVESIELPSAEKTASPGVVGRSGQAALLAAALAAAGGSQAAAAVPAAELDRAYLEALLHGSWTHPPDLTARRLPASTETALAQSAGEPDGVVEQAFFNDSFNPRPTPYHDIRYGDSAFGDRTDGR